MREHGTLQYPRIFIDAASHLQDRRLVLLAVGAAVYAIVRLVEAYGLFNERRWAEVLAAESGGIYVAFELLELLRKTTWHSVGLLVVNVMVVGVMIRALVARRRHVT